MLGFFLLESPVVLGLGRELEVGNAGSAKYGDKEKHEQNRQREAHDVDGSANELPALALWVIKDWGR
jgi:hypothetical protein